MTNNNGDNCHLARIVHSLASVRDTLTSLNPAGGAVSDPSGLHTIRQSADQHIPVLAGASPRDCGQCSRYAQQLQQISNGRHPTHPFVSDINQTLGDLERRMNATVDTCLLRQQP